ncbi:MAG: hypothetical protein FJY83_07690 [Candidatus Aminicenantes bacterium]|nr:hypothetical protein [Candidatus Aminicenantes bacterium]
MKKSHLRAVAVLVCLAFLVSMTPALQSAEKKSARTGILAALKDSLYALGSIFPFFSALTELTDEGARKREIFDPNTGFNLIPKPTSDAPSTGEPKTKD